MDNGARLPLYARARLGEGTRAAQGLHGVVGLSRGKESKAAARPWRWDGEGSLLGKDAVVGRESLFRMERGLAEPSSHPSPSLGIGRSACGEAEPWEPWERGRVWGKYRLKSQLDCDRESPYPRSLCATHRSICFSTLLGKYCPSQMEARSRAVAVSAGGKFEKQLSCFQRSKNSGKTPKTYNPAGV